MALMSRLFLAVLAMAMAMVMGAHPLMAAEEKAAKETETKEKLNSDDPMTVTTDKVTGKNGIAMTDAKKIKLLNDYAVLSTLVGDINSHFGKNGGFPEGMTIEITITNIRLRSGSSAAAAGILAGRDHLVTEVVFMQDGKESNRLKHNESSASGGLTYPPSRRIKLITEGTAEFVFKQSKKIK